MKGLIHNDTVPPPDTVLAEGSSAYQIRSGLHYLSRKDWNAYIKIIRKFMNDN